MVKTILMNKGSKINTSRIDPSGNKYTDMVNFLKKQSGLSEIYIIVDNTSNKPYRLGVNALIIDQENNFLLVQKNGYKDNEWNFLGGGREDGETLEQNLFREINEEIGSTKSDFEIIGISSYKIEYDYSADTVLKIHGGKYRGQSYEQVILRFIGDKDKLVFSTEEFRTHKWAKAKELVGHLIFPNQFKNHQKAIDELLSGILQ